MKRILVLAPLALTLSTPAFAGPFGHGPHRDVNPEQVMEHADKAMDKIDATEEQRDLHGQGWGGCLGKLHAHIAN